MDSGNVERQNDDAAGERPHLKLIARRDQAYRVLEFRRPRRGARAVARIARELSRLELRAAWLRRASDLESPNRTLCLVRSTLDEPRDR